MRRQVLVVPVREASQVGEARRLAVAMAERVSFDEGERGRVALVVTEGATNLIKHAGGGEILLQTLDPGPEGPGIEILALDQGPGLADVQRCLQDGYSTTNTQGTGLGAIVRLSSSTDIYSVPQLGTALLARLWARPVAGRRPEHEFEAGSLCLPHQGETVSGDAWALERRPGQVVVLLCDGLGHGPEAARASLVALQTFQARPWQGPAPLVGELHTALRPTRGAAVAVADLDLDAGVARFAGIGNIAGTILSPLVSGADSWGSRSLMSHNGTAGYEVYRIQEFNVPFPAGSLLVMHTDGLTSRWSLTRYPGLTAREPALIAGVLYRDFRRGRDDVTVLVGRGRGIAR